MNIIVIPDAAMAVVPLIEKNNHTYLSPSNFSKYNNMDGIYEGNMENIDLLAQYLSSEIPSGIRGRLLMFLNVLKDADAAIIINPRPKKYIKMYDALNDVILFGSEGCTNARNLSIKMTEDKDIPILRVDYPTSQSEIIDLINQTNSFLKNLNSRDFTKKVKKYSLSEVEKIFNEFR